MTTPNEDILAAHDARVHRIRENRRAAERRFLDMIADEWAFDRATDAAFNADMDKREQRWVIEHA